MKKEKSLVIDGQTEVDDLAFVSHFATNEYTKINELKTFKNNIPKSSKPLGLDLSQLNLENEDIDFSDSDVEYESLKDVLSPNQIHTAQLTPDFKDPLDNLRIIDTVDLPEKVSEELPISRIGTCKSFFDDILIIHSSPGSGVLDLGSIICKDDRTILGTVNDTFGPTDHPYYMVILTNKSSSIQPDELLYCDVKHSTFIGDQTSHTDTVDESEDEQLEEKCFNKLKQSYKDL
ncbi:Gar1/Naf1 RNA binding region family protein [Theileria parva strain Muguga]|uniref:Gar1/Naf1 RNA binding region family protein n=1 Tax=Theileria parva strain Muguga TaxID=333668 RepID=UPI001C618117|nr:Gar1/Naf1 RNA binding region family protein [Theileria parva strain Muguga]EAN34095.2 Gar1/Naf1 RNA binding region family protein [Theileria parva strain Muguga]